MSTARDLSATAWTVLALAAEGRTHGFAIARALESRGPVGSVWSARRPVVYRALDQLGRAGLVADAGTEPSDTGPPRRLVEATPDGIARLRAWLVEPVEHLRDARSLLLLKLLFLDRRDEDREPLVTAQLARFQEQLASLEARADVAEGFERTMLAWRVANARAAVDFLRTCRE